MSLKFLEALQLGPARKKTIRLAGAATASEGPAGASDGRGKSHDIAAESRGRDSKAPAGLSAAWTLGVATSNLQQKCHARDSRNSMQ